MGARTTWRVSNSEKPFMLADLRCSSSRWRSATWGGSARASTSLGQVRRQPQGRDGLAFQPCLLQRAVELPAGRGQAGAEHRAARDRAGARRVRLGVAVRLLPRGRQGGEAAVPPTGSACSGRTGRPTTRSTSSTIGSPRSDCARCGSASACYATAARAAAAAGAAAVRAAAAAAADRSDGEAAARWAAWEHCRRQDARAVQRRAARSGVKAGQGDFSANVSEILAGRSAGGLSEKDQRMAGRPPARAAKGGRGGGRGRALRLSST